MFPKQPQQTVTQYIQECAYFSGITVPAKRMKRIVEICKANISKKQESRVYYTDGNYIGTTLNDTEYTDELINEKCGWSLNDYDNSTANLGVKTNFGRRLYAYPFDLFAEELDATLWDRIEQKLKMPLKVMQSIIITLEPLLTKIIQDAGYEFQYDI